MRKMCMIATLVFVAAEAGLLYDVNAQIAATKAQQLVNQARAAIGGNKLKSIQSLSVEGAYRRTIGQMEMSGELELDMLLPDKMMKTERMRPIPTFEITRIETINGDNVWEDRQQHGGVVLMHSGGSEPKKAQEAMQQGIRSEFARLTIGMLLTTLSSFPVEYSFAGEAIAPDGKADVLDVKGASGFKMRLFLDQKTHRLLMLTYSGKRLRALAQIATSAPRSADEVEKLAKDFEAEAAKQPDVEYQIRFSDYRDVNGVSFPHKLIKSIENEVTEEIDITRIKINPQIKPEKFMKK